MMDSFMQLNPVMQAFLATLFRWALTAAGAALVFMKKDVNPKVLDMMLGFAAGVMIAASFWSLLNPGIEMAEQMGQTPWLTAVIGFMSGGIFMRVTDRFLPHLHPGLKMNQREGSKPPGSAALCWCLPLRCTISRKAWLSVWLLVQLQLDCPRRRSVERLPWPSALVSKTSLKARPCPCHYAAKG